MNPGGVLAVARLEVRQRLRAGRWRVLLAVWVVVVGLFTALVRLGLRSVVTPEDDVEIGAVMYGALLFFVLGLALLVVPALSSQSVNGDRDRGTLALLQVTLLRPGEIALGKLLASWGSALVFLLATVPFVAWCVLEGGVPAGRLAATLLVVVALLGVFCAIGLGWSALVQRTTTSTLLTYLAVFGLPVGTLVVFGLVTAVTATPRTETFTNAACSTSSEYEDVQYDSRGDPVEPLPPSCVLDVQTYETDVARTDRTWPVLAPNPFVVLADAAPRPGTAQVRTPDGRVLRTEPATFEPLSAIGEAVRAARVGPDDERAASALLRSGADEPGLPPVWPYGLAVDVALGAAFFAATVRRLRAPVRRLPLGQRVA